jgi:asparagine synthetase B (glutamine-hydrolysing)
MCGITGRVDFDHGLTTERRVLERMTESLRQRRPDAEGLSPDTHAAFGHRRLSVIDIEGSG